MNHEQFHSANKDLHEESRRRSDIDLLIAGGVVHEGVGVNISPEIAERVKREHELGAVITHNLIITNEQEVPPANIAESNTDKVLIMHDPQTERIASTEIAELSNQEVRFEEVKDKLELLTRPYVGLFNEFTKLQAPSKEEYKYRKPEGDDVFKGGIMWYKREQKNPTYAQIRNEVIRNGQQVQLLYEADMSIDENGDKYVDAVKIIGEASDGEVPTIRLTLKNGVVESLEYDVSDVTDVSKAYDEPEVSGLSPVDLLRATGRTMDYFEDDANVLRLYYNGDRKHLASEHTPTTKGSIKITFGENPTLQIIRDDSLPVHRPYGGIYMETSTYSRSYTFDMAKGIYTGANTGEDDVQSRLKPDMTADEFAKITSNLLSAIPSTAL